MVDENAIKVLLIEDDEDDYFLSAELLRESQVRSFRITWAQRLEAGLEHLAQETPDVVLLDLSLPDSQGIGTFLRIHEAAGHLPVILLTGLDDESVGIHAVQEGAQDYLVKGSIDSHLLVRAILYAIERKRTKEQLASYARALQRHNQQMTEDLNMARELQQAFLPHSYPVFPDGVAEEESALRFCHLYRPSTAVGGDFYSVLRVSDTCAGVFICDVMGHGMRAALITAIIRGLLEELRPVWAQPHTLLTQLNAGLLNALRHVEQLIFASACYMTVDIGTGQLAYSNAGHPPPLHIRRRSGEVSGLALSGDTRAPALGLVEAGNYATTTVPVAQGDAIVLYTDGLFEIRGPEQQEYGVDRLRAAAQRRIETSGTDLLQALVDDAHSFSEGGEFEDDVCLVTVDVVRQRSDSSSTGEDGQRHAN